LLKHQIFHLEIFDLKELNEVETYDKTTKKIVDQATQYGIKLFVEKGNLGYKSKAKTLNKDVLASISKNKKSVIDFLLSEQKRIQNPSSKKHTSLSQQRIWLIEKINANTGEFNIPININLHADWPVEKLKYSLATLLEQHDILKSTYHEENEQLWQQIKANAELPFEIVDLSEVEHGDIDRILERHLKNCAQYHFNLTISIPIRATLFLLPDNDKVINLTIHHIALDDFSCQLLLKQLFDDNVSHQATRPPQYCEYAEWQKNHILSQKFKARAQQYVASLQGSPALHALPTLKAHSKTTSNSAQTIKARIPSPLNDKIKSLNAQHGLTTFAFFQTCLAKFLSVWTNADDIVMGTPAIHRPTENTSSMLGCFLNLLVIRHQFSNLENLNDLLVNASNKHNELLSYQDIPFEHLLTELTPHRTPYFAPIFQILVSMHQHNDLNKAVVDQKGTPAWQHLSSNTNTTKYDLTVKIVTNADETYLAWQYKQDLFSQQTIEQLSSTFNYFLEQATKQPERPMCQLPLTCPSRAAQLVNYSPKDHYVIATPATIIEQIEQNAIETPDATAIEFALTQLSYHELFIRVQYLANQLLEMGIAKGDRVAIMMQRSPQMLLSMLAIMKIGAAYVPLDPDYPEDRLNYIFNTAKCKALIQDSDNVGAISASQYLTIDNNYYQNIDLSVLRHCPSVNCDADDSAYIIFTSGSTGLPKGVEVTHYNLSNFINSMLKRPGITRKDKLLAVTPISFDISILELFAPLVAGACTVIAEQHKRDGHNLRIRLEQYDISTMQATPATWQAIIEAGWIGSNKLKALSGGEALSNELANKLSDKVNSLWNMYGPTEATIWATCLRIDDVGEQKIGLGTPIDNTGIYILDKQDNFCPFEKQGEIIITGDSVAKGYFNQPILTQQRFFTLTTPHGTVRAYRTGDLGYISQDQQLFCHGRNDQQIKLRGFRIELPEIEHQIMKIDEIDQVCVVVKQLPNASKKLVSYVVSSQKSLIDVSEAISQKIHNTLPAYMQPDGIELMTELPLTPSGKVDRNYLTSLAFNAQEAKYCPPSNKIETLLVDIWQNCLHKNQVGISDNFFSIGGDSILAVRMISAVITAGYQVSNAMIFTHQTIQELAQHLAESVKATKSTIPIEQQVNGIEVLGDGISEDDLNSLLCEFE
jgi:amino acid adenylation domain-containing protein